MILLLGYTKINYNESCIASLMAHLATENKHITDKHKTCCCNYSWRPIYQSTIFQFNYIVYVMLAHSFPNYFGLLLSAQNEWVFNL